MCWLRLSLVAIVGNLLMFATASNAQYIQTPARHYRPIWNQYTPINVFQSNAIHRPIWHQFTPVNIYHYRSDVNQSALVLPWSGVDQAQPMSVMTEVGQVAPDAPAIPGQIVDADESSGIEVFNTDASSSSEVLANKNSSTQVEQTTVGDAVGFDKTDTTSQLQDPVSDELIELKNELMRKTRDLEIAKQEHEQLKRMMEQKILNALKEKQSDKSPAIEIQELRKENEELKALNDQLRQLNEAKQVELQQLAKQLADARGNLAKMGTDKKSDAGGNQPMTLGELAEAKRKQRKNKSAASLQSTAENLEEELKSQLTQAINSIRGRFEKKIQRASEQNGSREQIARLEREMELQVEKIRQRIESRFKRRIESSRRESKN